jgi:ABC-type spermidine/putrescine transport system permease subunit II
MRRRAQTLVLVVLLAVLSLSEVIIGFSLSTLLSRTAGSATSGRLGLTETPQAYTPSLFALMAGLCYLGFPYAVLVLYPPVSRLDPELGEAARIMGASPLRGFLTVTVPVLRAPILGALILVFVFTLGAYLLPQVLGRPRHWTLSVHITDQAIFQSNLPLAAAMAVVLLLVALAMVGSRCCSAAKRGHRDEAAGALYVVLILRLLAAPLVVITGVSLNGGQSLRFPPQEVSLRWYGALFEQPDWLGPLRNSVLIAALASLLAVAVALPLALHVWARGGWLGRALYTLGVAPFMLPPVITALGFLVFWISLGHVRAVHRDGDLARGLSGDAAAGHHLARVAAIDPALIEAARVMGATRGRFCARSSCRWSCPT